MTSVNIRVQGNGEIGGGAAISSGIYTSQRSNKVAILKCSIVALMLLAVTATARADGYHQQVLWHNATTGQLSAWLPNVSGIVQGQQALSWGCDTTSGCANEWRVVGTGNFEDFSSTELDVLWHNATTGQLSVWIPNLNGVVTRQQLLSWGCDIASGCAHDWKVVGTGYFEYGGVTDVLWHNATTGELSVWLLNPYGIVRGQQTLSWRCDTASGCASDWKVVGTGDFDGNGIADVLWHNARTGQLSAWLLDSHGVVMRTQLLSWMCDTASGCAQDWRVVGTGNFGSDSITDVLWHNATTGELSVWLVAAHGIVTGQETLSWRCDTASGCANDWRAVGVPHTYEITIH